MVMTIAWSHTACESRRWMYQRVCLTPSQPRTCTSGSMLARVPSCLSSAAVSRTTRTLLSDLQLELDMETPPGQQKNRWLWKADAGCNPWALFLLLIGTRLRAQTCEQPQSGLVARACLSELSKGMEQLKRNVYSRQLVQQLTYYFGRDGRTQYAHALRGTPQADCLMPCREARSMRMPRESPRGIGGRACVERQASSQKSKATCLTLALFGKM